MNVTPPLRPPRSIVSRSAENGLYLGAYLIIMAVLTGLGTSYGILALAVWAGLVYLPVLVYSLLRRSYAESGFSMSVPELWAETLMSFFLGAVLQAAAIYILLRFVAPGFVADQIDTAIATFESVSTPEGDAWAQTLRNIKEHNGLPTSADVAAQSIMLNIFCGAVLGIIDGIMVRVRYTDPGRRQRLLDRYQKKS